MIVIPGNIYVVFCAYIRPPKDKLCLCVCDEWPLFFFINTKIGLDAAACVKLAANDHNSLTRDCHLDLSQAVTFPPNALTPAKDRGPVSPAILESILAVLNGGVAALPQRQLLRAIDKLSAKQPPAVKPFGT